MSRWIDADAFKTWIDEYVSVFKKSDKAEIKGYISHQPSIEIIRCGECKHSRGVLEYCAIDHWVGGADDFCSYGSRSEKPNNLERSSE